MTDGTDLETIRRVQKDAERLYARAEIELAVDRAVAAISARLGGTNPLLLVVMQGGVVFAGHLLTRLTFPLQVDYVHVTRYHGGTEGRDLHWLRPPPDLLRGRTVLLVDDILDQGTTLAMIAERCKSNGAAAVYTAVLVEKDIARQRGPAHADFAALHAPDRYLFGWGMDYHHYLRNADGIYAVREDDR